MTGADLHRVGVHVMGASFGRTIPTLLGKLLSSSSGIRSLADLSIIYVNVVQLERASCERTTASCSAEVCLRAIQRVGLWKDEGKMVERPAQETAGRGTDWPGFPR